MQQPFKNKIIVITGASSGIGKSMAIAFAKSEAKLFLVARSLENLELVKIECLNYCKYVEVYQLDVSKESDIQKFAEIISRSISKIDILINCAGVSQRSIIKETAIEVERKIMETNFWGTVNVTKSLLPFLEKSNKGNIVIISSLAGIFGTPFRGAYSASKHALKGYFETLRLEYDNDDIKILLVYPGFIDTSISYNSLTGNGELHRQNSENQKNGISPDECASKILEAIINGKKEIVIGGKETLMVFFKKYLPSLFYYLIKKQKNLK